MFPVKHLYVIISILRYITPQLQKHTNLLLTWGLLDYYIVRGTTLDPMGSKVLEK